MPSHKTPYWNDKAAANSGFPEKAQVSRYRESEKGLARRAVSIKLNPSDNALQSLSDVFKPCVSDFSRAVNSAFSGFHA
jgi:hypothetical protein